MIPPLFKRASVAILFAALFFAPAVASAQIQGPAFDTLAGARSVGLGRTFSAMADDPSAIRINPAGLALAKQAVAGVLYQNNENPRDRFNEYTVSFLDAKTSQLAAGVAYSVVSDNVFGVIGNQYKDPPSYSLLSLALADTTIEAFHFGVTIHWLRSDFPVTFDSAHEVNFTVGALIPLQQFFWNLQVGVVGRNVAGSKKRILLDTDQRFLLDTPKKLRTWAHWGRLLPREFETTAVVTPWEWLRVLGGINVNFDSTKDKGMGYGIGGEVEIVKEMRFRTGFHRDSPTGDHFIAVGLGLEGKEASLLYAFEHNLSLDTNQHTIEIFYRWF